MHSTLNRAGAIFLQQSPPYYTARDTPTNHKALFMHLCIDLVIHKVATETVNL